MTDIQSILLTLKEQAIKATKDADGKFYENYLTDDAIAIVPYGIFNKNTIVQQMSLPNSAFKSIGIEDERAIVLNEETGIVTYKATYQKPDLSKFQVYVTTVYVKKKEGWKGVFYQQTPMINK